ncbi:hypothetical protein BHE74_00036287 [Ensete ventricosum]|nr:hypothetical protein GW17_00013808 [Ensete ventricosum]RWW56952.1 hypothetical protein BHE74_00036287 [Ensete ventricosum]
MPLKLNMPVEMAAQQHSGGSVKAIYSGAKISLSYFCYLERVLSTTDTFSL